MLRSTERYLTTHCGSLPRPASLTAMYAARQSGEAVDPDTLAREGQAALAGVLDGQTRAGIDILNNGEQQRDSFFLYVRHRMSGFGGSWNRRIFADIAKYPALQAEMERPIPGKPAVSLRGTLPTATSEVRYLDRSLVAAECGDFRHALASHEGEYSEAFLTAPSPGIIAAAMLNRFYDTERAYLAALGEALRVEYEAIVAHGYVLQIDAPDLAMERHITYQDQPLSAFIGFVERVLETINAALINIPRDRVRLHVCWGNYEAPHDCDVPLADILPVLRQADVGGFVLPFANPRHAHEYRCLEATRLDDDQVIVAGVIDPLTHFVEHPEVIADRIENVARAVGDPGRVIAGVDCGFDTSAGRGKVVEQVVWAKLASLAEGARVATARRMP